MESGHVSETDPAKNYQAPNSGESKSSSPHSLTSSSEVVVLEPGRSTNGTPANEQQHDGSSPLATSDRIPFHVFARTSTTTPTEWSEASNESLFSIHAGNTSFSKERLMCKSGEHAGYNCDSINISSPLLELPRTRLFTDLDDGAGEFGVTEPAAAEAMREVSMDQECQQKDDSPVEFSPHSRSISMQSDASVQSFAFPILTGGDKCGSVKKGTKNKKEQSRPSTSLEENTDISQENPKPEDSQETTHKTQTQKSTKNAGSKKWFNCFSCCSSCS